MRRLDEAKWEDQADARVIIGSTVLQLEQEWRVDTMET